MQVISCFSVNIKKGSGLVIPPWTLTSMNINLEIAHAKKSDTNPAFYQVKHKEIVEHFPGYNLIYTDGSLSGSKAASAAVLGDEVFTLRLPDKSSIFTAEMYALLLAFQQIEQKFPEAFYYFFGFKVGFTGPSVKRLDKSADFTSARTKPFLVYHFWLKPSIFVGF